MHIGYSAEGVVEGRGAAIDALRRLKRVNWTEVSAGAGRRYLRIRQYYPHTRHSRSHLRLASQFEVFTGLLDALPRHVASLYGLD